MSEWNEYTFTEVATLTNGRAYLQPELQDSGKYRIVRVGNLSGGDKWFYSDMELPDNKYCNKGDLLYAWACSFGPYIWNDEKTIYHYHIWKVDVNATVADKMFLYYYLKYYTPKWMGLTNGSVMMHITKSSLEKQKISLPPIETQQRISSILSSLDSKIENNHKICANLEAQAQALFKHWFIDFAPFKDGKFVESELGMIPEGWRVEKLGELPLYISDYVANGSFASLRENVSLYNEENYAYFIRNTDLKEKRFKVYVDKKSYDFLSKSVLHGGEIIISNVGDVGSVHLCPVLDKPMTLGNNIIMIKSGNIALQNYLYILFKYSYGQGLIHSITGGTAQPKFNKTDFKSLKIVVPGEKSLQEFNDFIKNLLQTIQLKDSENNHLSEIRDSILPKLMSGEIKV